MNWNETLDQLEKGTLRSASKIDGKWVANTEVKKNILEAFKAGRLTEMEGFVDKDTLFPQKFTIERNIRIVPGGSTVRRGAYVAPTVIIMPPSYINVGAFVDEGTLVDGHCLVGSCAQIGKRVHLSTGVKIGGVLEPIGESPVVVEDDAFIGAGTILVEGVVVGKGAVIAPGVILSRSIPVFDVVKNQRLKSGMPIPENAVVVSGTRPLSAGHQWGRDLNLQVNCAIIIKYRDENTDASLELEELLR